MDEQNIENLKAEIDRLIQQLEPMGQRSTIHKLLAILAAIVTVLVKQYFHYVFYWHESLVQRGSAKPIRSISLCFDKSSSIKRRNFPWSFIGIITVLSIAALGAASDPATFMKSTHQFVQPHFWTAMLGTAILGYALLNQYLNIYSHSELVEEILGRVKQIRSDRGLEVEV